MSRRTVRTRVGIGLSLTAGFLFLAWLDSGSPRGAILHILAGGLMVCALLEFYALAEAGGYRPRKLLGLGLVVAFVVCQFAASVYWDAPWAHGLGLRAGVFGSFYPFLGLAATAGLGVLVVGHFVGRPVERYLPDTSAGVLGFVYVWLLGAHVLALRAWWGLGCVLACLAAAKLGDVGAYFAGTFLGRHKLAPKASPNKTVEGALGGLAASVVVAALVGRLAAAEELPAGLGFWALFGLLVGLAAQLGDLVESAMKRSVGAKDSAHLFPAFGGVLDLIDSVLLSAPVALWLVELWGRSILGASAKG